MPRVAPLLVLLLALAVPLAPASAQTTIVAVVNGEPITSYDVSQRQRLLSVTGARGNTRELAIDELINEKVQNQAAMNANVTVPESMVDEAIASIASRVRLSPAQLRQGLGQRGVNMETLKDRVRAQIAFNRLIATRFRTVLQVSEQDLVAALLKDSDAERTIETAEYELEQVIIALPENPSSSRLRSAETTAANVRSRFSSCREGLRMARDTRNVVVRPFGRRTAPELQPAIRTAVEDVAVGRLSEPVRTPIGLVMFAVCDKKTVRSTNAAMKAIEPDMTNERGEAFAKQYLRQLRRDAIIERR